MNSPRPSAGCDGKDDVSAVQRPGLEVWKFGGASLADARAIQRAAGLIARHPGPVVVVASALAGITDQLLEGARLAAAGKANEATRIAAVLLRRHREIARDLLPSGAARRALHASIDASAREYRELCGAIAVLGHIPPRASDILVSRGERMSAALLAAVLSKSGRRAQYVDACSIVATDAQHGGAAPNLPETGRRARRALRPLLAAGTTPVVPGFIGQAPDGSPTTLGRGGSDLTATLLAGPLGARKVVLWKDVRGILTADPRPGAGRAPDPAAAPSRGGGGGALRSQGPPSARTHPDRRYADRAARSIVPRSRGAGHGSLRAPIDGDVPGQGARDRAGTGDRHRRRQGDGRRARHCGPDVRGHRGRAAVSLHDLPGIVRELDRIHARRFGSAARGEQLAARVPGGALERPHRQRDRAARHGRDRRRRRRHGRQSRHCRAGVLGARDGRHQCRRDRAGVVGAKHLVRGDGGPGSGGGAPRPHGISAVEDRRRPSARRRRGPTSCSSGSAASGVRSPTRWPRRPTAIPPYAS